MATQTRRSRQAAASKAAATRKSRAAKQSASRTKASVKRTSTSARSTTRAARGTGTQAARTASRSADAAGAQFQVLARQAERAVLIPVGAALEVRDALIDTVRTYSKRTTARRRLNRFERRGATALRRNRRAVERQAKSARRDVGQRTNGLRDGAEGLVEQVRELV